MARAHPATHVRRSPRSAVRLVRASAGPEPLGIELGLGGFGNGSHPTTRMLVDELIERICGSERVLDVGCGSGVLGLCALRLGAAQVVAVDIKPEAVEATRRNAALNGLAASARREDRSPDQDRRYVRHRRREHRPRRDRRPRNRPRPPRLAARLARSERHLRVAVRPRRGLLAAARRDRPKGVRRMGGGRLGLRSSRLGARPISVANHLVDPDAVRFDRLHVETAPGDARVLDAEDDDPVHGERRAVGERSPPPPLPDLDARRPSSLPRAGRRGSRARRKRHLSSSRGPARFREKLDPGARAAHCGSRSRSR